MSTFPRTFSSLLIPATLAAATLLSGCANMVTTAGPTNAFTQPGSLSGHIHGGNQPIGGASIKLYAVGTGGYGSAGTLLATTTSAQDGFGSWGFTQVASGGTGNSYTCPSSSTLLYIIASGGNTTGSSANPNNNPAAVMMAAVGACGTAGSAFIDMNEVTSVASVWALQQYINPGATSGATTSVGAPNTTQAQVGITNAFANVANLANVATGTAILSKTLTGTASTVAGAAVTMTGEQTKINAIANILAACVNQTDGTQAGCTTLFSNAAPPSAAVTSQPAATFPTAGDTLQAAYYMAVNPTDGSTAHLTALYNQISAVGAPFQPSLAAAPTDWTLGLFFNAGTSACAGTASGKFIFYAYQVRADAAGNIWISSNGAAPENISAVSPNGTPLACVTPNASAGLYTGLEIDIAGNIWAASHSGFLYEINPSTLAVKDWTEASLTPWGLTSDGVGNVYYSVASKPIHKFTGASSASVPAASTAIGSESNANPNFIVADGAGNIWAAETAAAGGLFQTYPDSGGTAVAGYSTYTAGTAGSVQAQIAVDGAAKIWTTQTTPANSATIFTPGVPPAAAGSFATAAGVGGMSTPRGVAIDGAGNAWIPNGVAQKVSELDKNGNALSPSGAFTKSIFSNTMRSVAIDPSGNVWIGTNATTVDTIEEIVGAGVPVITPLAAQLASGSGPVKP